MTLFKWIRKLFKKPRLSQNEKLDLRFDPFAIDYGPWTKEQWDEFFKIEKGAPVTIHWIPGFMETQDYVHEVRFLDDKIYYLTYYRDSDGPIAGWQDSTRVTLRDGPKWTPEQLDENINYGSSLEELRNDAENAWTNLMKKTE